MFACARDLRPPSTGRGFVTPLSHHDIFVTFLVHNDLEPTKATTVPPLLQIQQPLAHRLPACHVNASQPNHPRHTYTLHTHCDMHSSGCHITNMKQPHSHQMQCKKGPNDGLYCCLGLWHPPSLKESTQIHQQEGPRHIRRVSVFR